MKKSQASLEYLMIVGAGILMIIGSLYVYNHYSLTAQEKLTENQVNQIANNLVDAAEEVYYLGHPSQKTIEFLMPLNVEKIVVLNNNELVFCVKKDGSISEMAYPSRVSISLNLTAEDFSKGSKKYFILAKKEGCACITSPDSDCPACAASGERCQDE